MASRIIGRATCPECGFAAAHVKESDKCVYRYCPDCGAQHHARTPKQRADLLAKTRLEATATATEPSSSDTPTPTQTQTATTVTEPTATPTKRRGLF